jgi:excinuclease ABC subunit A
MGVAGHISLRGVAVHNLKAIDLDIPHGKLIVLCGLSGSGKSSLALDTLYAEGQRRYIESFSAYTRQFLDRLEKPEAERIEGIPPAIAVTGGGSTRSSRSTVGTATEVADYLRLLFAKIGRVVCRRCGQTVQRDTPQSVAQRLTNLPGGTRFIVAFELRGNGDNSPAAALAALPEEGFIRAIIGERVVNLYDVDGRTDVLNTQYSVLSTQLTSSETRQLGSTPPAYVIVDRLAAGGATTQRIRDSLETAFAKGQGKCFAFVENGESDRGIEATIDGRAWRRLAFSTMLACADCGIEYTPPEPRLFSFNSPLGACPQCEGFGNTMEVDMDLVVPDPNRTIREGAIAPWNTPAYAHELEELLALAPDYDLPVDVPVSQLTAAHRRLIEEGVPERNFGGLAGFFAWLERRKYKMHIRVFLSRWRRYRPCAACGGTRLRPEALDARVGGRNIAQISAMQISAAAEFFRRLLPSPAQAGLEISARGQSPSIQCHTSETIDHALTPGPSPEYGRGEISDWERRVGRMMLDAVQSRLGYLESVGLGYLTLDRTIRTLSGGETRRVSLTSAMGSSLVNMLYVLDEPSIGLHPRDVDQLVESIRKLRNRANTVVVVEHEEAMIRAADQVIEIGPGAGERGGRVVFQGTPAEMETSLDSLTGDFLSGRRGSVGAGPRRQPNHGWIRLAGARGNNLRNITVEFPLGMLCLVTGVSGAGKSSLVEETLYPALCRRLRKDAPRSLDCDDVFGDGQIDDVIMVDQSPIGRTPRSNPVTYLKVFDEIRRVFAETTEARTRNYDASHFSFNVNGGRCSVCEGEGHIKIDMQFLADVYMKCSQCHGTRYRDEILDVTYRGRNIADVLEMTVREAFTFFRGKAKVQSRLKRLIDVGLDYVRLGQPANTLSGGEAQRLKLAGYMSAAGHRPKGGRGRCLFILDEPTTGLHFSDTVQLLDCFDALLSVGHSLIVVEHNLQVMKAADYIIDLGPGAADKGGKVVAKGTPEMVARCSESVTARYLGKVLGEQRAQEPA